MESEEAKDAARDDCSFIWDETTQLYYHASSGFYHDPNAGWYYNSRDGLYYKFENGSYELLQSDQVNGCEAETGGGIVADASEPNLERSTHAEESNVEGGFLSGSVLMADESDSCQHGISEPLTRDTGCGSSEEPEFPPPPSNWLEETLINLYLSGYKQRDDAHHNSIVPSEMDGGDGVYSSAGGNEDNNMSQQEMITNVSSGLSDPGESNIDEAHVSAEEESWRAQYGQVVHDNEDRVQDCTATDLWDWTLITGSKVDGHSKVARLVGRLVKRSAKLHPSMHTGGGLLRTAPICEVHLDLVRVKTGQIYKLRNPSSKYLASLSTYDSSNPTKDWCFPELSSSIQDDGLKKSRGSSDGAASKSSDQLLKSTQESHAYRDRAAERRKLHGGYGVGPGQKIPSINNPGSSSPEPTATDEVEPDEGITPFGAGSYARKILEGMGWKEGDALGGSRKGLVEPIQAVGNTGNAGLGWPTGNKRKHR
ncbi:unnamed protein product [Linum trigynum]|uniref:G-patch domain-containing protein n=1 Tax=Linum trigynum TaxID=586398 RepID=A0AAV2EXU4_9ROSI